MTSKTLVVLEPPVRDAVEKIARQNHVSISGACRDLIKEALEIYEDVYFGAAAADREKDFDWSRRALTHSSVWGGGK